MIKRPHRVPAPLGALAHLYEIDTAYRDVWGHKRTATPEALCAALRVFGVDIPNPDAARAALCAERETRRGRLAEPIGVIHAGRPAAIAVWRPRGDRAPRLACRVRSEDGWTSEWHVLWDDLHPHRTGALAGDAGVDMRRLPLMLHLPPGYHRLELQSGRRRAQVTLLCTPGACYRPSADADRRGFGVFAPVHALRSDRDWGIGDFGHLRRLRDWVQAQGGDAVATLPLLATYIAEAGDPSPYAPVSRLFLSEVLIDVEGLPEWREHPDIRERAKGPGSAGRLRRLRAAPLVMYEEVLVAKRCALEQLAGRFFARPRSRQEPEYRRFLHDHPEALAYARFRACTESRRQGWPAWPHAFRQGRLPDSACAPTCVQYHLYVQYCAYRQLSGIAGAGDSSGRGLYLDFPIGVHGAGFDTWRWQSLFASGASVGAPPDMAFTTGQDWGFPPVRPDTLRADGYDYFRTCVAAHMRYADWLRFDHVMGFHRLYVIPHGVSAKAGVYLRYRPEEYQAVLAIESHRHRCRVVGENLGTVPPEVTPAMHRKGMYGLYVLAYEALGRPGRRLRPPARLSITSLGTHDFAGFTGFWQGADIRRRRRLRMITAAQARAEQRDRDRIRTVLGRQLLGARTAAQVRAHGPWEVLRSGLGFLADSRADFVLVAAEDLRLEPEAQNIPSSNADHPNWRRRMDCPLAPLMRSARIDALLAEVRGRRSRTRRVPRLSSKHTGPVPARRGAR